MESDKRMRQILIHTQSELMSWESLLWSRKRALGLSLKYPPERNSTSCKNSTVTRRFFSLYSWVILNMRHLQEPARTTGWKQQQVAPVCTDAFTQCLHNASFSLSHQHQRGLSPSGANVLHKHHRTNQKGFQRLQVPT